MEEVAFNDWPGQPVDLDFGPNPWLPAYGFQTPAALLEKEDFIGNPDAEYFLQGATAGQYMYLETIQEETSDDLCSESDVDSRGSPVGWLATDSEKGSVICIGVQEDADCESDRELACPAKRRKQETLLSFPNNDDDISDSLSRSSSLLQFETFEKQCQESSSSPSIYSQFSFDSLEISSRKHQNVSPDSLNSPNSSTEDETDFYKTLKIDVPTKKKQSSKDSLLYNISKYSGSESSDSDITLEGSRSLDNLKTWRSFESLPINGRGKKEKHSVENLSEDSGYSDHLSKGNSAGNLSKKEMKSFEESCKERKRNTYVGFVAYDGDFFQNFNGNFGVSYQDLSIFDKYEPPETRKNSPLIDHFLRKKRQNKIGDTPFVNSRRPKIDQECGRSKFNIQSSSVPNLLTTSIASDENSVVQCVSSVPKDLNFITDFGSNKSTSGSSVAEKNWNLADLQFENNDTVTANSADSNPSEKMANYRREGSYTEAMSNRVDLSDDENSLRFKKKLPKTTITEFDKRVLKAISEQSIQSILGSNLSLSNSQRYLNTSQRDVFTSSTPKKRHISVTAAASTPDLNRIEPVKAYYDEDRRKSTQEIHNIEVEEKQTESFEPLRPKSPLESNLESNFEEENIREVVARRKGSIIKSSTSTSGMSDVDDRTLRNSVKSFTGSSGSKGVHFSPVVSEVNWRDDGSESTATPERESSYSLGSSSPEPERDRSPPKVLRPKPRYAGNSGARRSVSQPDLSDTESRIYKREFVDSLKELQKQDLSKSQPDFRRLKRTGSQLVKKDKDGCLIKAYVDLDGIQYKHTHLDLNINNSPPHQTNADPKHRVSRGNNTNEQSKRGGAVTMSTGGAAMETATAQQRKENVKQTKSGKLGGFFQRLASFRFSAKKGQDDKGKAKKKQQSSAAPAPNMGFQQRVATKDDYVYIPLKGPPTTTTNNNSISSKPPLPKQPPRVVHASVKPGAAPGAGAVDRRRRRTIDSDAPPVSQSMEPMGLIETDLDTEVTVITSGGGNNVKTRSLLNLGGAEARLRAPGGQGEGEKKRTQRPHKSMEFLLDKQNLKVVEPPENELQKGERVMSEHQLRVQRSLQKLTVPEWYKQSQVPREGFLLKKHTPRESRWTGTSSKTTSLSNLGSGTQSPMVLSPTPCSQPFVRWSTSKLNSTASSPCQSTRSSFNTRQPNGSISPSSVRSSFSYRQPYMGWRSQERLTRPRTPAERLASTILNISSSSQPQESPEIQTSIKEVTSAIVHYVSGLKPDEKSYEGQDTISQRSSSVSPKGSQRLCWLESSFVGTKPLDSPQTPVTCSESHSSPVAPQSLRLELQGHNDE